MHQTKASINPEKCQKISRDVSPISLSEPWVSGVGDKKDGMNGRQISRAVGEGLIVILSRPLFWGKRDSLL